MLYLALFILFSVMLMLFKNTWCDLHHVFCCVMWIVALFLILDSYIISITNSDTHTLLSINSIIMFLYPLSSFSHINVNCNKNVVSVRSSFYAIILLYFE